MRLDSIILRELLLVLLILIILTKPTSSFTSRTITTQGMMIPSPIVVLENHYLKEQSISTTTTTRLSLSKMDDDDDDSIVDYSLSLNRRSLFLLLSTTLSSASSSSAFFAAAADDGTAAGVVVPSDVRAPIELLLPATRVKLYIDQAVELCEELLKKKSNNSNNESSSPSSLEISLIPLLRNYLLVENEPTFMTENEQILSKQYLQIKTSTAWQDARRKERESRGAELGIDYTTPYDQINTMIQQWGDNRQFQILRSRQQKLEEFNTIRKALNAYTNNLVFGNSYQLNVQGDEKKTLVRNDALPNVNAVVVSDLDLRDLYRNQILQNIDDARAEIEYQFKNMSSSSSSSDNFDVDDIITYLRQAQLSCQDWFNLIPKSDIEEAYKLVIMEERSKDRV